jgi:hypothetical protein
MTYSDIQEMADAYIVCALFTADEFIVPPKSKSGEFDPSPYLPRVTKEMRQEAWWTCKLFYLMNRRDLQNYPADSAGHDLWYTRNGHGVGFWEANHCTAEEGERLTKSAKRMGESYLESGKGGWLYFA